MAMMHLFAGIIAGFLTIIAYLPYLLSTLKGKTKPNRATWWILVMVGVMLATSYYALGAKETLWVPFSYVMGPLVIAIISIKFGEGGFSFFDIACITGAILGMIFWWVFSSPLLALIINLAMDFLGLLPTIKKAYKRPHTEDEVAWFLWFAGSCFNLIAMDTWNLQLAIYPIYMVIGNGFIAFLVFQKYLSLGQK